MIYKLPVEPFVDYEVVFHWAEGYFLEENLRTFSVLIDDVNMFPSELDVVKEAGGPLTKITRSFAVTSASSLITIKFVHGTHNNPFINGIELYRIGS